LKKTGEFVMLNICVRIAVRVPVDLHFGYMADCQHFEIGGLPFHLALFSLRNFHAVAVFSHLL
jgi:hypothetical protein